MTIVILVLLKSILRKMLCDENQVRKMVFGETFLQKRFFSWGSLARKFVKLFFSVGLIY